VSGDASISSLALKPRRWQLEALAIWKHDLRGIVAVVTGGGKTLFGEMCIEEFLRQYPHGRVVIIVPTTALLDQWFLSLQDDLKVSPEKIATYSGEGRAAEPGLINLVVINTARVIGESLSAGSDTFVIVDECHRAGSPENARALYGIHRASLGLSATPERDYDEGLQQYVVPTLGEIIFRYTYEDARRDGVISPFDLVNVGVDLLPREQIAYDSLTRRIAIAASKVDAGEDDGRLKRLLMQRASISANARMRVPATLRLVELARGQRTIVFHERVQAADSIHRLLQERGYSSTIYHTGINPVVRRDNLRLFRKGLFDVMVCCRALDEGLNVPEASAAVIASSTASNRQRIQRLGRVLRPAPDKERATVYTIYATAVEEQRLRIESSRLADTASIEWLRIRRGD
jgi:superfamily II DNA or RNA helicase